MQLRRGLSFHAWLDVGRHIGRISNACTWWLGDWVVYGEQAYGERYKAALEATQLDYQTLRNYAWVARSFEPARRRDTVSFQHHSELAALPEADQDLWLERTERSRWSRNELRRQLRADCRPDSTASDDHGVTLRLPVTTGREQLWRQAAAAAEQDLVDWIAAAADDAAQTALNAPSPPKRDISNRRLALPV
jgi:hypothetical protein